MRELTNTERVLKNKAVDELVELEKEKGSDITFEEVAPFVVSKYKDIMQNGHMDAGAWSCGMVAGLIHDIPSCQELMDRIMNEANDIIKSRLAGMV